MCGRARGSERVSVGSGGTAADDDRLRCRARRGVRVLHDRRELRVLRRRAGAARGRHRVPFGDRYDVSLRLPRGARMRVRLRRAGGDRGAQRVRRRRVRGGGRRRARCDRSAASPTRRRWSRRSRSSSSFVLFREPFHEDDERAAAPLQQISTLSRCACAADRLRWLFVVRDPDDRCSTTCRTSSTRRT